MAVNLSAQQFLDPGLEMLIGDVLSDTGLSPRLLALELTESVSMSNPEESIRILGRFHAMGIGLAIDDFGTGYSNLSYLLKFPVHELKLDRSFISELGNQTTCGEIVESVIHMAHRLGLQVIAEGVETIEQRDILMAFGCDVMQGYWFSRPLDAGDCTALLSRPRATALSPVTPATPVTPVTHAASGSSLLL